jgi:RNA polymerase sigma-70 factor (ECF subfamily)
MLTLAGEQEAYEALVTKYQNAAISAAATVTRNSFMAEDAAQDAFVTAWMKLDTLKEPKKFASWVCRIAKNCALNMFPRYRSFLSLDESIGFEIEDGRLDPETEFIASDERRRDSDELRKSMEGLPEKVGEIIRLHYFEGLSIAEIADRMRISEGTVKSQLHDSRKKIRRELFRTERKME